MGGAGVVEDVIRLGSGQDVLAVEEGDQPEQDSQDRVAVLADGGPAGGLPLPPRAEPGATGPRRAR